MGNNPSSAHRRSGPQEPPRYLDEEELLPRRSGEMISIVPCPPGLALAEMPPDPNEPLSEEEERRASEEEHPTPADQQSMAEEEHLAPEEEHPEPEEEQLASEGTIPTTDLRRPTPELDERTAGHAPLTIELGMPPEPAEKPKKKPGIVSRSKEKIKARWHSLRFKRHRRLPDSAPSEPRKRPEHAGVIEGLQQALEGVAATDWAKQGVRKLATANPIRNESGDKATEDPDDNPEGQRTSGVSDRPVLTQVSMSSGETGKPLTIKYHYKWPYAVKDPNAPDDGQSLAIPVQSRRDSVENPRSVVESPLPQLPDFNIFDWDDGADGVRLAALLTTRPGAAANKEGEDKGEGEHDDGGQHQQTTTAEVDPKDDTAKETLVGVEELQPRSPLRPSKALPLSRTKSGASI